LLPTNFPRWLAASSAGDALPARPQAADDPCCCWWSAGCRHWQPVARPPPSGVG
jgi:hypothetical protein